MFLQDNTGGGGGPSLTDLAGALKDSFTGLQDSIFDFEDQVARINRTVLGQGSVYANKMRVEFAEAAAKSIEFGGTLDDVANTFASINKVLQTNTQLTDEQLTGFVAIEKAAGLTADEMGTLVEAFDTIGYGTDQTIASLEKMSQTARSYGLNVGTFLNTVGKNLKLVNSYNFKDGVEGFTRMVARSQALRIEMGTVQKLAGELLNPEKAVELAAEFQNLGGAVGALGDPFQLMNMAQNDMEGLQNAIVDAAKSSVMFNEKTGKFQISATEMRRLRAQADALGMSYEDLADTAVKAAKEQKALDQLRFTNITDEQKQLIANMADMNKDGKLVLKLPEFEGTVDEFLSKTPEEQKKLFDSLEKQQTDANKSSEQIARDQLSTLESILVTLKTPAAKLAAGVAGGEGYTDISNQAKNVANNVSANLSKLLTEENYNTVRNKIVEGIQSVTNNITWDQGIGPFLDSVKNQSLTALQQAVEFFGVDLTSTVTENLNTAGNNIRTRLQNNLGGTNTTTPESPNQTNGTNTTTQVAPVQPTSGTNTTVPVTPSPPPVTETTVNLSNLNVVHTGTIQLQGINQVIDVSRMSETDIRILSDRIKQVLSPELLGN